MLVFKDCNVARLVWWGCSTGLRVQEWGCDSFRDLFVEAASLLDKGGLEKCVVFTWSLLDNGNNALWSRSKVVP